jgi:hypothetical protein
MVKVELPCAVGVPEMVTAFVVLVPSESPAGKLPEEIVHANREEVPFELTVAAYAVLRVAVGSEVVVIAI